MRAAFLVVALAACSSHAADLPTDAVTDTSIDDSSVVHDPCDGQTAACPVAGADVIRGRGLYPIDQCAFPMTDTGTWESRAALVDALPDTIARKTFADVALDLNRAATTVTAATVPGSAANIKSAFQWQSGDAAVTYWIPQGITGSFDANAEGTVAGRKILLVSWYYEQTADTGSTVDKGVRLAVVDVTNPAAIAYRLVLLVDPISKDGRTDLAAIKVHAGGLAWVGDYLYVPVTGSGFRVFDLSKILQLSSLTDTLGYDSATDTYAAYSYKYAIPQIAEYKTASACAPIYSFVALDRSTTPLSLISGEYDAATVNGRLYRWPLDEHGKLQITDANRAVPSAAWFLAESHVQGAVSNGTSYYLSSSRPGGTGGELVVTKVAETSTTKGWIDSPEDLAFDPQTNRIWGLSELAPNRYVISASK